MMGFFKTEKKEKTKASNTHEYSSGFNLVENILNTPHQHQHQHPTLPSTSTAHVQMQAVPTPSSAAPKLDVNDVMVSSLSPGFTQMQVGHSGSGQSASTLGHTMTITDATTLDHKSSNKREPSRISSTVTIGQEKAFDKVCDFLTKSEVGIVGIYGMGGVGKTTLMKKVCYEFLKPSNYMVIWIVVSRTVNVGTIQRSIMRELNLSCHEEQDPQACGMKINEALFNNKDKVALLLDDIWEDINLEELGVKGGCGVDTSKFKIIFTTRSEDVCLQMDPDQKMKIECLGQEESWTLFKQSVGEKALRSHDQILGLAKEVAKECAGLPLALTVIGKSMICKTSLGAWDDALKRLRNCHPTANAEKNLFERLKFSYDKLENQVERECFLFCCVYPEDTEIDKDILVRSWIGEGLLDVSYGTYQEACNRGHDIIDTLVAKSLLESKYSSSTDVKMHDVIRDMGLWIGSESNYFVHTNSLGSRGEEIAKRWNTARWIYVENCNDDIPQELDCPNLSTLHICPKGGAIEISNTFMNSMHFMRKVKALILNNVLLECREIPTSTFGLLAELRHLEIRNSNVSALPPDIGNLTKLLVLILIGNRSLTTLPPTIGGLCQLRNLEIRTWDDHLRMKMNIPSELGKLKKLEMVDIFTCAELKIDNFFNHCAELRRLDVDVFGPTTLSNDLPYNSKKLEELRINSVGRRENYTLWIKGLKRLTSLKVLTMDEWPFADGDDVIFAIGAMHQLRELHIIKCAIGKLLIPAATDFLPQLEVLYIGLSQLTKVHFRKRALQSLCNLGICNCSRIEHVVGLQHLLQLRKLEISNCCKFEEELTTTDVDGPSDVQASICFPNLQRLRLQSLPGMKRICNDSVSFPSLSEFNLSDCPKLEKLPRGLMNENRTQMLSGKIMATWEGLEWEDDDFKLYLRPLFVVRNRLIL